MTANGPQRVVWSEGLLIGPQHLQQLDLYHERLLGMRLEALDSLPWGLVSLELDGAAITGLSRIEDGKRVPLTRGRIQLQSEGAETFFRNIVLTPIKAMPKVVVAD